MLSKDRTNPFVALAWINLALPVPFRKQSPLKKKQPTQKFINVIYNVKVTKVEPPNGHEIRLSL